MEDYYGWGNRNRGKMTAENEEFQEEEVWAVNSTERETSPSKVMMMRKSSSSWRLPVAPRTGGNERRCRAEQSSAPVAIFELFSQERKTKPTAYYVEHYVSLAEFMFVCVRGINIPDVDEKQYQLFVINKELLPTNLSEKTLMGIRVEYMFLMRFEVRASEEPRAFSRLRRMVQECCRVEEVDPRLRAWMAGWSLVK
nr:uncharacterized protein LOC109164921 [Ipomoea batatas]